MFSKIVAPLNKLLEKNRPFVWTTDCMEAYNELKKLMLREPVVAYPDFSVPFRLWIGGHFSPKAGRERKDNLLC